MSIAEWLRVSVKHNASDLHLSAGVAPMIRVDGMIQALDAPALSSTELETMLAAVMTPAQKQSLAHNLELDFALELAEIGRFRVNVFHQSRGIAAVLRTIPQTIPTLDALQVPAGLRQMATYQQGLILVTGATGSGKSTTLAALLDHINRHQRRHIITLEDPIEFVHVPHQSLINQREMQRDSHSFQQALRSALREDPDVILVGELRDHETISLALTAAETGHLVLATLHTSSATKSINRLIDVFPSGEQNRVRSMLAESLQAVIAQTLLPRRGGGRVACHEILLATPAIRNLIREDKLPQIYSMLQTGSAQGMQTMEQAMQPLIRQGIIEPMPSAALSPL